MSTETLALIIFAVILIQVAAVALVGLYRRKQQFKGLESRIGEQQGSVEQQPTTSNITPIASPEVAEKTPPAWQGFKDFIVQRRVMEDAAESICSFCLIPVDGQPLPSLLKWILAAGQAVVRPPWSLVKWITTRILMPV